MLLDKEKTTTEYLNLQLHQIETEDDFFQFGQTQEYQFFKVSSMNTQKLFETSHKNHNLVFNSVILLDQTGKIHTRKKYAFFDLLGDLGGVLEVILLAFGFVFNSIAYHSFLVQASKKLFYARTMIEDIFKRKMDKKTQAFVNSGILSYDEKEEVKKHRPIDLSLKMSSKLYMFTVFRSCLTGCCNFRNPKYV